MLHILLRGVVFALDRLPEHKVLRLLGKLLIGKYTILDKYLEVVPLALVVGAQGVEELLEAVGNLACDVARYLLDIRVALKVATRHIERDVGRVDNTVQQHQVLRHDARNLIGNKYLI